jgi:DNA-binding SARP family transcriptional activator
MTQLEGTRPRSTLDLLGGFALSVEDEPIPMNCVGAKIFAVLALQRRPIPRPLLAEIMWPARPPGRAQANLRSVVWRLPVQSRRLLHDDAGLLTLRSCVDVDVHRVVRTCHSLLAIGDGESSSGLIHLTGDLLDDLLPSWGDDWVITERARLRLLRLHALEALSARLLAAGRVVEALEAAAASFTAEPLRESAARAVITAHLASGNVADAHAVYLTYRSELMGQLGIEPSVHLLPLLLSAGRPMTSG